MSTHTKPHTLLIVEPIKLLAYGIQTALRQGLPDLSVQLCTDLLEPAALRQHITFVAPDIIIANPLLTGLSASADLIPARDAPLLVAINHGGLSEQMYSGYSLIISPAIDPRDLVQRITALSDAEPEPAHPTETMQKQLSQRECEVVAWVARGLTNKEIADRLCLSPHTVVTHRRNIAAKLDIHSPSGLTIYALMNNLISMEEAKGL